MTASEHAPYHAHIYFDAHEQATAEALRQELAGLLACGARTDLLFVGRPTTGPAGPHPIPQYEVHFLKSAEAWMLDLITARGLRALVHPLTDDDLADHTSLAHWIGAPIDLDVSVLDPPGHNQGIPRFGKSDF
jgi:DOPA 4,5-dioxygenase